MLAAQRQAQILDEVQRRGAARVSELAGRFGVSDMTIRRDLDALVARGRARQGARRRDLTAKSEHR